ncbi:hypothetical protein MRX96_005186 [Rhipicephalus microplus]
MSFQFRRMNYMAVINVCVHSSQPAADAFIPFSGLQKGLMFALCPKFGVESVTARHRLLGFDVRCGVRDVLGEGSGPRGNISNTLRGSRFFALNAKVVPVNPSG